MSKAPAKLSFSNMADYRKSRGLSQVDFWKKIGVTQSGGSRYETGRDVPRPVKLLLTLLDLGIVTDDSLDKARKAIVKAK